MAGLYALHRQSGAASGLAVALAASIKVTPSLFGLYFLWSRRGWALAGGALGLAVFLFFIPGLWLGWSYNAHALSGFAQQATGKLEAGAPADEAQEGGEPVRGYGISLRGTLVKLLSPAIALPRRPADEPRTINVVSLEPATAARLADALALALLIGTVWLTWPRAARTGPEALALSWGLVAITMLLISPHTRKAHAVVLLIPTAALAALLLQERLAGAVRKLAWAALVFLGAATLLTAEGVIGERAAEVAHAAGAATWAMVFLYVALACALRQITRRVDFRF
jgi:hypothetical protein